MNPQLLIRYLEILGSDPVSCRVFARALAFKETMIWLRSSNCLYSDFGLQGIVPSGDAFELAINQLTDNLALNRINKARSKYAELENFTASFSDPI